MLAKSKVRPGFSLVFAREIKQFRRQPFLLLVSAIMPLILFGVLSVTFNAGLATRLPIAVLDLDGSDLSRTIIRTVDATPDTAVAVNVSDLAEGRRLIASGNLHGLLLLPENLERDIFAGRRPEVTFFYNSQTLTTGNLALRGVNAAVPAIAASLRLSLRTAEGQPIESAQAALAPIPLQVNPLFNPTINYSHFLLAALIPAVLQISIITTMAYSVGNDAQTPYRLRVLRRLGGGLWRAIAGKILPYTLVFLTVLGLSDIALFAYFGLPLRGDRLLLLTGAVLFILSSQFAGALLALLLRPVATAVSIATLIAAPAFGFMGIGFPRLGMNAFAYYWGSLLPGTSYLTVRIDQTLRGTPFDLSIRPIAALLALAILYGGLLALRLDSTRLRKGGTIRASSVPPSATDGVRQ